MLHAIEDITDAITFIRIQIMPISLFFRRHVRPGRELRRLPGNPRSDGAREVTLGNACRMRDEYRAHPPRRAR